MSDDVRDDGHGSYSPIHPDWLDSLSTDLGVRAVMGGVLHSKAKNMARELLYLRGRVKVLEKTVKDSEENLAKFEWAMETQLNLGREQLALRDVDHMETVHLLMGIAAKVIVEARGT